MRSELYAMEHTQVSDPHPETSANLGSPGNTPPGQGDTRASGSMVPVRRAAPELPKEKASDLLAEIRRFCQSEPNAGASLAAPDAHWLPAALYPYRNQQAIRQDYPLFLSRDTEGVPTCLSIVDLLFRAVENFAPEADAAKILKDNLARLEVELRSRLSGQGADPADATPAVQAACDALERTLALKAETAEQLHTDLAKLINAIPVGGVFLPMTEQTALQIYLFAAEAEAARRAGALHTEITALRSRLRDLLATEHARGEQGRDASKIAESVGGSSAVQFDAAALSRVLGSVEQGEATNPERLTRIERTVATFDRFLADPGASAVQIISRDSAPACARSDAVRWTIAEADPCIEAEAVFERLAHDRADLFTAIRTARLELDNAYDPARHDTLVLSLDWRSFSKAELLLVPPVLAIESPEQIAGAGMLSLSRLLLSGRPVGVLVNVAAAGDPGGSGAELLTRYRLELAYLGIGHREALVNQTTAARPTHLLDGFGRGLGAMHASLHVVASGLTASGDEPALGAWLHGGAALEGRAHPLFHYDPEAGETWARRLDFSMNPSPEDDWPVCEIPCLDEAGAQNTIASRFSFADFALLEEAYRDEYRLLPAGLECESFVEAAEYFQLDTEASSEMIPFVWATDSEGVLHRLAFTRRLGFACRDRLGYWHTLQELSGVRNEYVLEAVQNERERMEAEFATERGRLLAEHTEEVERVRTEAAGEALRRLAEGLVNADLASLASGAVSGAIPATSTVAAPTAPPKTKAPAKPTEAPPMSEAAADDDEDEGFDEPYIDTPLCTTCNDCMAINAQVFVYNANKQAVIADAKAGTFEQIVMAAEKCPAKCIHPGKPLNPSESGLDALIERAKPFN